MILGCELDNLDSNRKKSKDEGKGVTLSYVLCRYVVILGLLWLSIETSGRTEY